MSDLRSLSSLFENSPFLSCLSADAEIHVSGITDDSRQVEPGYLFVAVPGVNVDGHCYIESALQAGATAVVGERPRGELTLSEAIPYIQVPDSREALGWLYAGWYDHPSKSLVLVGVTGTDGKTTTTNLIYAMLSAAGLKAGMMSTVNVKIGTQSYDTGLHTTTPPSSDIQRYLAKMVEAGTSHAVLETTSHGLAQRRLAGCHFDIAVVTNVTHEHLDYHGSWDAYIRAKARLFENVADPETGCSKLRKVPPTAVLNGDDPRSLTHFSSIQGARQIIYALNSGGSQVYAQNIQFGSDGLRFQLVTPRGDVGIASSLVGLYNVSNILAAASAAEALGLPLSSVAEGTAQVHAIPGRMERIDEGQDFIAIVDFAHTPNALRRALEAARTMVDRTGNVIAVFGSAGLRDREKRYLMGKAAGELADLIVVTAEDPRTEPLERIMEEVSRGLRAVGREEGRDFWRVPDRGRAIRRAVELARKGDIVLAFGKGHEQSMCFGEIEYPWDDRQAMRLALQGSTLATLPTSSSSGCTA
jgi:UDP-N-acetylmuramoyl-L-alanyl-D-glutamate--2,6-diaminopimelate ligase